MTDAMLTEAPTAQSALPDSRPDVSAQLDRLSDRMREVVVLRYFHDRSERENATIIGIPAGTVKSRLHQAIRVLRKHEATDGD